MSRIITICKPTFDNGYVAEGEIKFGSRVIGNYRHDKPRLVQWSVSGKPMRNGKKVMDSRVVTDTYTITKLYLPNVKGVSIFEYSLSDFRMRIEDIVVDNIVDCYKK